MTNYKDLVKNFSGKVHIADIQEEFDRLLTGLAQLQAKMEELENISDLDFTKGKNTLSAEDFTLTLGGLKKILQVYNNKVIKEPVIVKLPDETDKYKAFPGLYCVQDTGIMQTKDDILTLSSSSSVTPIYADTTTNELTTNSLNNVKVSQVRTNRSTVELESNYIINEPINTNISIVPTKEYTLTMKTKTFDYDNKESAPEAPYFILPKVGGLINPGSFYMGDVMLESQAGDVGADRAKRRTWYYNPIWYPSGNPITWRTGNGPGEVEYMKFLGYTLQ